MFWRKKVTPPEIPLPYHIGDIIYESVDTFPKYPLYIFDIITENTELDKVKSKRYIFHLAAFVTEFHTNKIKFLCFKTIRMDDNIYVGPVPEYHDEQIRMMINNYKDTGILEFIYKPSINQLNEEPEIYDKDDLWDCYIVGGNGLRLYLAYEVSSAYAESVFLLARKDIKAKADFEVKSQLGLKRIYIPFSQENRLVLEKSRKR